MDKLVASIRSAQRIVLISHINPDGDAISSLAALQAGLQQIGKEVESVLVSGIPAVFSFLCDNSFSASLTLDFDERTDLCLVADANDASRTGCGDIVKKYGQAGKLGCLDHHLPGDLARISSSSLIDQEASSTCELAYRLLTELGVRLTPYISTALLTGIFTDTGGFHYPNTSSATLELAAELMRRGARLDHITHQITHGKTVAGLRLLGRALERVRLSVGGQIAVSALSHDDIAACEATPEDIAGIVGELNTLPGVQIVLLLAEQTPGMVRGIVRSGSSKQENIGLLAKVLGGGGHARAAGFSVPGRLVQDEGKWKIEPIADKEKTR